MPICSAPLRVDDVPVNIKILADALSPDYRIKVAGSGPDALEIAGREPHPDLILLDITMPGMDGFQVCRQLKADPQTQKIPLIFITARDGESDEELGLNLGAVDYIVKPFSLPVVKARIRNHIRLKLQADLLESLSMLDGLTHIANRRRFDQAMLAEWKRAARDGTPFSLVLVDIDYFKQYNDHYCHGAGDLCLQTVAEQLSKGVVRPGDLVSRYGGEEFAVILPTTDQETATQFAERLHESIEKLRLPHAGSQAARVVIISLGVAGRIGIKTNDVPQSLIDAADKALYQAKKAGRNRVSFSER